MKFKKWNTVVGLMLLVVPHSASSQKGQGAEVPNVKAPSVMRVFDASGTRLIKTLEAPAFRVELRGYDNGSNQGMRTQGNRMFLQEGDVTVDPNPDYGRLWETSGGAAVLGFDSASTTVQIGHWPTSFVTLLQEDWKGINRFSLASEHSAGSFSMTNFLAFDLKRKTLEKTVDTGTWSYRIKYKLRFLGVTPVMLDATSKEPDVSQYDDGTEWGREIYLPKHGVRVIEVLESNKDFDFFPEWFKTKVRIVWRCPRPKETKSGQMSK